MDSLRGGRYVITRPLGDGAQGSTYEAVDKREGRLVAVKRYVVREAKEWKSVELAEREAKVLAQLSHPRLPAYIEHFEEDGALYLVMERIPGVSIDQYLARGAVFDAADVRRFLEDASEALAYLHGRTPPVIHRDIKPKNVVRRPDGSFALVDFGAVTHRLKPHGGSTVVGTFGYMAPEQFQGRASPATDVYAVGATALYMLTHMEPEDLPHKGLGVDVGAALGPRASPELVAVLSKMLEPDPDKRPKSIAPLLGGFEVRGKPRTGPPPGPSTPPPTAPPPAPPSPVEPAPIVNDVLRAVSRYIGLLWALVGFAWWLMPSRVALGVTIGTVILTIVTRPFRAARKDDQAKKVLRKYSKDVRVRVDIPEAEVEEALRERRRRLDDLPSDEAEAPAERRGRR